MPAFDTDCFNTCCKLLTRTGLINFFDFYTIAHTQPGSNVFVSPCGVRFVWQRHDLETFAKGLSTLEAKVAQDGLILKEAQVIELERKKEKKEAFGEIETEHPCYLGALLRSNLLGIV